MSRGNIGYIGAKQHRLVRSVEGATLWPVINARFSRLSLAETQPPQPPRRNRSRRRRNRGKRTEEDEDDGSPTWQREGEISFSFWVGAILAFYLCSRLAA